MDKYYTIKSLYNVLVKSVKSFASLFDNNEHLKIDKIKNQIILYDMGYECWTKKRLILMEIFYLGAAEYGSVNALIELGWYYSQKDYSNYGLYQHQIKTGNFMDIRNKLLCYSKKNPQTDTYNNIYEIQKLTVEYNAIIKCYKDIRKFLFVNNCYAHWKKDNVIDIYNIKIMIIYLKKAYDLGDRSILIELASYYQYIEINYDEMKKYYYLDYYYSPQKNKLRDCSVQNYYKDIEKSEININQFIYYPRLLIVILCNNKTIQENKINTLLPEELLKLIYFDYLQTPEFSD